MTDASDRWKRWHVGRTETVPAPHGPRALTGRYWLEEYPDGQIPDVPGVWTADGHAVVPEPRRSAPGHFTPYRESRTVRVPNADGRERGLGLDGEPGNILSLAIPAGERTLL
ncbi:hypothetical protein [Streptomyces sp. NPDC046197]|uniref:hypothetical protein n=1 Tax=Streptomyces sp. NPDC046197 TaxID=3154337 RepID=UPI0033D53220